MRVWVKGEEDILKVMYPDSKYEVEEIALQLKRSLASIRGKAFCLGITRNIKRWKTEFDNFLKREYKKLGTNKCAEILEYSTRRIQEKVRKLGLQEKIVSFWTEEETNKLREMVGEHYTQKEMALVLEKTTLQVGNRIKRLGLISRGWSEKEIAFLKENYNSHNVVDVANHLKRKKMVIYRKASELGITQEDNCGPTHYAFRPDKREYPAEWTMTLRKSIRKRDNYQCQICNKTQEEEGIALQVHHIDYNKENNEESNLITLCRSCHPKTNNIRRKQWTLFFTSIMKEKCIIK